LLEGSLPALKIYIIFALLVIGLPGLKAFVSLEIGWFLFAGRHSNLREEGAVV